VKATPNVEVFRLTLRETKRRRSLFVSNEDRVIFKLKDLLDGGRLDRLRNIYFGCDMLSFEGLTGEILARIKNL